MSCCLLILIRFLFFKRRAYNFPAVPSASVMWAGLISLRPSIALSPLISLAPALRFDLSFGAGAAALAAAESYDAGWQHDMCGLHRLVRFFLCYIYVDLLMMYLYLVISVFICFMLSSVRLLSAVTSLDAVSLLSDSAQENFVAAGVSLLSSVLQRKSHTMHEAASSSDDGRNDPRILAVSALAGLASAAPEPGIVQEDSWKQRLVVSLLPALEDCSPLVVAAGVNALIDAFAGDGVGDAALFERLKLLGRLRAVLNELQLQVRSGEGHQLDRDASAHVKETKLNLQRFIKYKSRR